MFLKEESVVVSGEMRWTPFSRLLNQFLLKLEAVSHGALRVGIEKIRMAFLPSEFGEWFPTFFGARHSYK